LAMCRGAYRASIRARAVMVWFWLHLARITQMRGFIEELRRRNVFHVGVACVVTGWLIVQVADIAADAFNAPDWFMQILIIVLNSVPVRLYFRFSFCT